MAKKVSYKKKDYNSGALNAGAILAIEDLSSAEQNGNLPHNQLFLANMDTNCVLFVFLDDMQDVDKPDYILFPRTSMFLKEDEGVTFKTVFLKNDDGANNISAKDIIWKVETVKEV
jgi:hypothetical protein